MISGKIILKSGTSVSLDKRFSDIAKQTQPRIQQQANVIISNSRQELFGNRRSNTLGIAQRLKKRSINNQLGRGPNTNRPIRTRVFQRLGYNNRRRGGGGGGGGGRNNSGANSYLFGGQSGLGVRLRGQGRIGGPRTFRPRTRGYLNNNTISRFTRGNRNRNRNNNNYNYNNNNSRGRRNNNNNFNRGRGGKNFNRGRGRGRNNNTTNKNLSKESLDTDLDKYMGQTKIDSDSIDMNAV